MNTRSGRALIKSKKDTPVKTNVSTPNKNSAKKTLFTPCRRVGLGRKKVLLSSPSCAETSEDASVLPPTPSTSKEENAPEASQPISTPAAVEESPVLRRKKSSSPVKRTKDDSQKPSEGNATVLHSPVHKKRKLEQVNLKSDKNRESGEIDTDNACKIKVINNGDVYEPEKQSVRNNSKSNVKSDIDCGVKNKSNFSLKVSLPIELSHKFLLSALKTNKKGGKNQKLENVIKKLAENQKKASDVSTEKESERIPAEQQSTFPKTADPVDVPRNSGRVLRNRHPVAKVATTKSQDKPALVVEQNASVPSPETKPIKKRKVKEKKETELTENILEDVENFIPSVKIDKRKLGKEVTVTTNFGTEKCDTKTSISETDVSKKKSIVKKSSQDLLVVVERLELKKIESDSERDKPSPKKDDLQEICDEFQEKQPRRQLRSLVSVSPEKIKNTKRTRTNETKKRKQKLKNDSNLKDLKIIDNTLQNVDNTEEQLNEKECEKENDNVSKTPNIVTQIMNDFHDDFDDDFQDITPRSRNKIIIKNKTIIDPSEKEKNSPKHRQKNFAEPVNSKVLGTPEHKSGTPKKATEPCASQSDVNLFDNIEPHMEDMTSFSIIKTEYLTSDSEDSIQLSLKGRLHNFPKPLLLKSEFSESDTEDVVSITTKESDSLLGAEINNVCLVLPKQNVSSKFIECTKKNVDKFRCCDSETTNKIICDRDSSECTETENTEESCVESDSISKDSEKLLGFQPAKHFDGRSSITDYSDSSSNYTAPTFSPIDGVMKSVLEKELWSGRISELYASEIAQNNGGVPCLDYSCNVSGCSIQNEPEVTNFSNQSCIDSENNDEINCRGFNEKSCSTDTSSPSENNLHRLTISDVKTVAGSDDSRNQNSQFHSDSEEITMTGKEHNVDSPFRNNLHNLQPIVTLIPLNLEKLKQNNANKLFISNNNIRNSTQIQTVCDEPVLEVTETENEMKSRSPELKRSKIMVKKTENLLENRTFKNIDYENQMDQPEKNVYVNSQPDSMHSVLQNGTENFKEPITTEKENTLVISKVQAAVDESKLDSYKIFNHKNNVKKTDKTFPFPREESVFFTPPCSRSENDSDSNRNDFQTESESSPTERSLNPPGEGTSNLLTLHDLSVTNLEMDKALVKSPNILMPELVDKTHTDKPSQEDKEVEEIVPKSPAKKALPRGRTKKKPTRPIHSNASHKSYLTNDKFGSDSDDDFQTPHQERRQSANANLFKHEGGMDKKIKAVLKKPKDQPLNRTENFRITASSTVTALHRGQVVEYIKSHDNDLAMKSTESDDNQHQEVQKNNSSESMIKESIIYKNKQRFVSMFDSVIDDPDTYLNTQTVAELKLKIRDCEFAIKAKEKKLEQLRRTAVLKKMHNIDHIKMVSLKIKKCCQEALLELAAVVRETSYTPFDMATLLHNMHIPNHIVGYNPDLDEFT